MLGVKPDLQLILVVFLALRRGSMSGQIAGFVGGLLEDVVTLSPLGFHAIVKALVGFCAGLPYGLIRASAAGGAGAAGDRRGADQGRWPAVCCRWRSRFRSTPTCWRSGSGSSRPTTWSLSPLLFALLSQIRLLRTSAVPGRRHERHRAPGPCSSGAPSASPPASGPRCCWSAATCSSCR